MLPERIVLNFSGDTSSSLIEFGRLFHNLATEYLMLLFIKFVLFFGSVYG